MTQKTDPEWFTCPGLEEGGRVAIQLTDGTLIEGYWYDGAVHDEPRKPEPEPPVPTYNPHCWPFRAGFSEPFWPNRPPAPWRIRCDDDEWWLIEKRQTVGYETWCRFDTSTEAFAAFAAGGA
ncbi:hypothetical protein [Mycobacteroides abscessus]|jgi:hypothetical protein|uniref:hypothetical protein n=1 Tax=Mycobacteroides abscessus TaxID=36809 RepID=UPI00034A05FE|nr:hypothetical protein [Mycobacteroides abscessus]MDM1884356.1 hypothetical protein [Mycobacteroides abscessus]MDM1890178.1 hypothetical protein [Mycobacteroides abscessus]OLT88750.1 hypothetical protein BKG58_10025 [Mycobacteroides abscessus subsp. abscessus]RIR40940.1 hypothetical protein D2E38_01540 [Mycobacteroides abscessus]RIR42509.1 hypothetical protein D2E36_09805 [Mycobacteroides abscessus]